MRVEISKDIFEKSDFNGLNYIFQILTWSPPNSTPRYKLFINLEKVSHISNYQKLNETSSLVAKIIEDEFTQAIQEGNPKPKIDYWVSNQKHPKKYNIEEAIRFFSQPVSIVLENSKNDANFIKAIIDHFDTEGVVKVHLRNGWVRFENAGGFRNVKNFLEGSFKAFDDLAARNDRDSSDYFRGIVILDSDKNFPDETEKPEYEALKQVFSTISFHILEKRAMENYMPDEVFEELKAEIEQNRSDHNQWKKMIDWINAYQSLSKQQKDFLNISKGFSKSNDDNTGRKQKILEFYNFKGANFQVLDEGFAFKGKNFKNEFPLLFVNSTRISKKTLSDRDGETNELIGILQKISKLL
jgi:hypothetical protein